MGSARKSSNGGSQPDQEDLKTPEWEVLTQENPPKDYPFFMSKKVSAPKQLEWAFENVLLLERLREVNALIGFTRVEAPDEGQEDEAAPKLLSPGTNQTLFQHLKCMVRGYL